MVTAEVIDTENHLGTSNCRHVQIYKMDNRFTSGPSHILLCEDAGELVQGYVHTVCAQEGVR